MKLFVAGLSGDIDEIDLKEMFELYGEVKFAQVITDRQTRKSKGFGFVEMLKKEEAVEAMNLLNGVSIFGKKIVVQPAEENPSGRSGNSGGGRQGGYNGGGNNRPRFR